MITSLDVLRRGFAGMHGLLDLMTNMTPEQFNFRPSEGGVSPFFSLWHYVRTEDNIINFVIQQKATVWLDGGYDVRLGLPRVSQGTGMTKAEADAVQIHDTGTWREYQQRVWRATGDFVASLDAEDLQKRRVYMKPQGERPLSEPLFLTCVFHGYRHAGEVEYARGVLGLGNAAGV
jgi:hypothetical protein